MGEKVLRLENFEEGKMFSKSLYNDNVVEKFNIVCLDGLNNIIETKMISEGTQLEAKVYIQDIVDFVLENKVEKIIFVHNHPKSRAIPSNEDIIFTAKAVRVLIEKNILVLDHIIVGEDKCFSFLESKMLNAILDDAIKDSSLFENNVSNKIMQHSINHFNY